MEASCDIATGFAYKKSAITVYILTLIKPQDGWSIHHLRYSCECVGGLSDLCDLIINYVSWLFLIGTRLNIVFVIASQ